uniref:Rab-GAP TBC domain-containing protein n=1 Tax=Heterorhabditis bacteriophora TaxID=37862 RepID=A0A1I7XJB0_HETBA
MSEEYAFCTLVKIMYDYRLRDLFKLGFDSLHLRFYQLTRLLKDYESALSTHLEHIGVETHMYASQWFLTLFTAKFPLQMVFFIVDLFLCEGMNTIFHISLALLHDAAEDLLQLDFEGALKYFRVTLPRKYRTEANAKALIQRAVDFKLKHKRLVKYEKEYLEMRERERENEDPLVRLQKENARHCETVLRLERENDDLAHELVTSKIELRRKLDTVEDQLETSANTVERLTRQIQDLTEENRNLHREYDQIKEMYRREVIRLEEGAARSEKLLSEYKQLFSQMSRRLHMSSLLRNDINILYLYGYYFL